MIRSPQEVGFFVGVVSVAETARFPVGVSLVAKARCQSIRVLDNNRYREQAHSYTGGGFASCFGQADFVLWRWSAKNALPLPTLSDALGMFTT